MSEDQNAPPTTAQVVADALEAAASSSPLPHVTEDDFANLAKMQRRVEEIGREIESDDASSAPQEPTAFIVSSGGDYWSEPMCDADDAKGVAAAWKKDGLREPITIHPLYLAAPPAPPLAGEQIVERVVRFMCEREGVAYAELADWPTARREGLEAEARDLIAVVRASLPSSPTPSWCCVNCGHTFGEHSTASQAAGPCVKSGCECEGFQRVPSSPTAPPDWNERSDAQKAWVEGAMWMFEATKHSRDLPLKPLPPLDDHEAWAKIADELDARTAQTETLIAALRRAKELPDGFLDKIVRVASLPASAEHPKQV